MDENQDAENQYLDRTIQDLQTGRDLLNEQYLKMRAALQARTQMPFDPALMKLAAGFLAPTKTGSFGESLGYATQGYVEEAEKEAARQQAQQKMQLELEQKMYDLRRNAAIQQYMLNLGGGGGGRPSQPAAEGDGTTLTAAAGAPAEVPGGAPTSIPAAAPAPTAPPAGAPAITKRPYEKILTEKDIANAYALGGKELGDQVAKMAKFQQDNVVVTDKGIFNKATGKSIYTDAQLNTVSEYDFPYIGTKKIPLKRQLEFEALKDKGDAEGMMNFFRKNFPEDVRGVKPSGEKITAETMGGELRTAAQKEAEKEERVAAGRETGKSSAEKATLLANRAESAIPNREAADDLIAYATTNPRVFGLLQQPGISGAVARAAEEGLRTGNFSISLPASTLATYNLSKDELNALQMAAQASMRLQVQFRRMERIAGEGAMSDLETKMFAALAPQMNDSPTVIRLKSELLKKRSDFDERLYEKWIDFQETTGKSYQKFMTSDAYKKEVADYRKVLKDLRDQNSELFSRGASKSSSKPAGKPTTSGEVSLEPTQPSGIDRNNKWLK